jgi:hypothetical protein
MICTLGQTCVIAAIFIAPNLPLPSASREGVSQIRISTVDPLVPYVHH